MKTIKITKNFKDSMKDVKNYPDYSAEKLEELINIIANGGKLDLVYKDHAMANNSSLKGLRGFHLKGNLVIIYKLTKDTVELIDIGKHNKVRLTSSL